MNVRFAEPCRTTPLDLVRIENEIAERSIDKPPCHECVQDIYLGFFFDGTNNNKYRDTLDFAHSNVARLYEAYIGNTAYQTPPTLATNAYSKTRAIFPDTRFKPDGFSDDDLKPYRKIYVPGVGTPFPDISDSGQDQDRKYGLGMAFLGEARLCWALLQVCNQMHAAITGKPLRESLPFKGSKMWYREYLPEKLKSEAENDQAKLEAQLAVLEKELDKAVKARGDNKPTLRSLRLSVFASRAGPRRHGRLSIGWRRAGVLHRPACLSLSHEPNGNRHESTTEHDAGHTGDRTAAWMPTRRRGAQSQAGGHHRQGRSPQGG